MKYMWNLISVTQLERMLQEDRTLTLADLRDETDYGKGHIPHAVSIRPDQYKELLALKEPVVLICYRGPESMRTARWMAEHGRTTYAVCGGMEAWNASHHSFSRTDN
jgi:rhodanese-related sulfurtransferase